jgi:hypothetical protein
MAASLSAGRRRERKDPLLAGPSPLMVKLQQNCRDDPRQFQYAFVQTGDDATKSSRSTLDWPPAGGVRRDSKQRASIEIDRGSRFCFHCHLPDRLTRPSAHSAIARLVTAITAVQPGCP